MDPDHARVSRAIRTIALCAAHGRTTRGTRILDHFMPLVARHDLTPPVVSAWFAAMAALRLVAGDHSGAIDAADRSEMAARGLSPAESRDPLLLVDACRVVAAVTAGDTSGAREALQRLNAGAEPMSMPARWFVRWARLTAAFPPGRTSRASGASPPWWPQTAPGERGIWLPLVLLDALARAEDGTRDSVRDRLARLRCHCSAAGRTALVAEIDLILAGLGCREDGEDVVAGLRVAFDAVRTHGCRFVSRGHVRLWQRLCTIALSVDVARDVVNDAIERFSWPAPGLHVKAWPWPVRVRTLGEFSIERDGEPVKFAGKQPRRPLALLKAIIAFGGSRVALVGIARSLWGSDDRNALRALEVALLRLRRLLGRHDALVVQDGQISVNDAVCWVDALAFDRALADVVVPGMSRSDDTARRVLDLYRGDFLPVDPDASWAVAARERWHNAFSALVHDIAAGHEAAGAWEAAIALYERGISSDALCEAFYEGQMRCYLALDRPSEGLEVYSRLRRTLSAAFATAPRARTEATAEALRARGGLPAPARSPLV
ncbi:MAG: hypothetical protein GC151_15070 [Betaproteobacteria bacterium]|nr:hypothetical protein [Betaproteobacteria bacterium]